MARLTPAQADQVLRDYNLPTRTISGPLRDVPALRRSNDLAREAARQRRWEAAHEILRD